MPYVQRERGVALSPNRYPRINWTAPYARGLIAAYSGDDVRELVTGLVLTRNAAQVGSASSYGPAAGLRAAQSSLWMTARRLPTTECTILWAGHRFSSPGADACYGGITFDSANSPPYVLAEIKTTAAGAPVMTYNNAGTLVSVAASAQVFGPSVLAMRVRNGTQEIRFNGVQAAMASAAFTSFSAASTARLEVGDSLNTRNPNANCAGMLIWNRFISDAELFAVEEDWRIVLDAQPERVFYSLGGGPATLVVQDLAHAHVVDALTLTQAHALAVADAAHSHAADSIVLTQAHSLALQEALHAHSADAVMLTQANALTVAEALHGHTSDGVTLTQQHALAIADALHAHSAEQPTLSVEGDLLIADVFHLHAADGIVLTQAHALAVSDALHGHAADGIALSLEGGLVVSDAVHAHLAEALALTQAHFLVVSDAVHQHLLDVLSLSIPGTGVKDSDRVLVVQAPGRTLVLLRASRVLSVAPAARSLSVH